MRFLDVFAGIGGFRMGLENAGFTCIGHIEIDKYARASYEAIYDIKENEYDKEDITEIEDFTELKGKYELLCGGFPCQSFSFAGKRKGFNDTRGTMFFYLAKILEQTKPPFFLFENVKGLLSHDQGETFKTIICTLDELGYDCEWQLLNSKDFGVPQNRERVYITGHLRGTSRRKIFPIGGASQKDYGNEYATTVPTRYRGCGGETYIKSSEKILQTGKIKKSKRKSPSRYRVFSLKGISPTIDTMRGGGLTPHINENETIKLNNGKQAQAVYDTDGLSCTLLANAGGQGGKTGLYLVNKTKLNQINTERQQGKQVYSHQGLSPTILASGIGGTRPGAVKTQERIRRLTPRECWRLQGFPDWAFDKAKAIGTSDTQLYKQAGNAVTVNVIEAIGNELKRSIEYDED